jgi:tetratricopeptide (TPR) repeat protein
MKQVIIIISMLMLIFSCKNDKKDQAANNKISVNKLIADNLLQQIVSNPDSVGLRLQLINALDSLGNYKEAVAQMDSLTNKDSLNFGLWYRKGQLLESAKDTLRAINSFIKAINIYPSPDGLLSLANLLAEKRSSTALTLCQQVRNLRPGKEYSAHCNFISGVYYARTGHKLKAIQQFDNCINDNYTYIEAYQEKGFIYYDAGKYEEALQIFQLAAKINNTYPDAYYWQGKCYEALNKKQDAIKNYQTSLILDKGLKEASAALKRLR